MPNNDESISLSISLSLSLYPGKMSEEKQNMVYGPNHAATKLALKLRAKKEASKNNKLPHGYVKEALVEAKLIDDIARSELNAKQANVYRYVTTIVTKRKSVAKPCKNTRTAKKCREFVRRKADIKKIVEAPGGDDGEMC